MGQDRKLMGHMNQAFMSFPKTQNGSSGRCLNADHLIQNQKPTWPACQTLCVLYLIRTLNIAHRHLMSV